MDGNNEILLGTYTQEIVVFTLIKNQWQLTDRRKFDAPIHSMCYLDLTGDGVRELVVLTQRGVYILQVNILTEIFVFYYTNLFNFFFTSSTIRNM